VRKMIDLDVHHKRVLIREDFNVPLKNGVILNNARLIAALPTLQWAIKNQARIMILSHLGRPIEGKNDPDCSLFPVAKKLSELLNYPVKFGVNWLEKNPVPEPGEIILLENTRFNLGEEENSEDLSKKMANLCDIFVMDAFATAHRKQASTYGVAQFAPIVAAGPLLVNELDALRKILKNPARPLVAIVGGSKVSTKMPVLENLLKKVDSLIVGGGIANTFLAAKNRGIGRSLYEPDWVEPVKLLPHQQIYLPVDVVVGSECSAQAIPRTCAVDSIFPDEMILDIGPKTIVHYTDLIKKAGTVLWNGPVGVFEIPAFSKGTEAIARAIADSRAFSLAGGGDTLSAIDQFNVTDKISYISTGGGAFLEFIEGKILPGVAILEERAIS